jgi:hypothetical protein
VVKQTVPHAGLKDALAVFVPLDVADGLHPEEVLQREACASGTGEQFQRSQWSGV